MHIHVGMNLWPETIIHARCKLLLKAKGVRPGHRLSCLRRPAGKVRWPRVMGTSDLRTDPPCSRRPHSARSHPAPARPSYIEDGQAPCKDYNCDNTTSQPATPSLESEDINNLNSRAAPNRGYQDIDWLQLSKMSLSLSPLAMTLWRDGR